MFPNDFQKKSLCENKEMEESNILLNESLKAYFETFYRILNESKLENRNLIDKATI